MRLLILSFLTVFVLAIAGCGGSSSDSSSGSLGSNSTCSDWNAAPAKDKNAYMASKGVETGKGNPGEAIEAWMDYLCGKTNPSTSFSSLSGVDDVFPAAQKQFTTGPTFPPVAQTKTAS